MISFLASIGFAAALCQATPIEKTLRPEKRKMLPSLYADAKVFKCEEIGRELVIVSKPIIRSEICKFDELNFKLRLLLRGVAFVNRDGTCPAISFSANNYPGSDWIFALDYVSPKDALQIKSIVAINGIALLDDETARRGDQLPDIPYGTSALTAFSVGVAEKNICQNRISPSNDLTFEKCFQAAVYNDWVKGWLMYFGRQSDGTYHFIASSRIVI